MRSNNKQFSFALALVATIGIGTSAFAGQVTDTFATGDTLTAAKMNAIKNAVNDTDNQVMGTGPCTGNNALDEMVRVGDTCIDKNPATLWSDKTATATDVAAIPGGCNLNGTGCTTGFVAQSRAAPGTIDTAADGMSWARAAIACANAGKHLITAAEWLAGRAAGVLPERTGSDTFSEWVDGAQPLNAAAKPRGLNIFDSLSVGDYVIAGTGIAYDTATFTNNTNVRFRCAR